MVMVGDNIVMEDQVYPMQSAKKCWQVVSKKLYVPVRGPRLLRRLQTLWGTELRRLHRKLLKVQ